MKLHNLIKPVVLSLSLPLAFSANAWEPVAENATEYNFATVKAGGVFPTSLEGNSGLNTGGTTYTAGFEMGRKFMDRYSVGFEYMHRGKNTAHAYDSGVTPSQNNTSWSAQSDTFMLNLAADLITDSKIRPYFKVGAGISKNKSFDYTVNSASQSGEQYLYTYPGKTENKFAWQAGAGLTMNTSAMFDTQLEYMFVDRGEIRTSDNYSTQGISGTVISPARTGKLKEHLLTVGIKFKF